MFVEYEVCKMDMTDGVFCIVNGWIFIIGIFVIYFAQVHLPLVKSWCDMDSAHVSKELAFAPANCAKAKKFEHFHLSCSSAIQHFRPVHGTEFLLYGLLRLGFLYLSGVCLRRHLVYVAIVQSLRSWFVSCRYRSSSWALCISSLFSALLCFPNPLLLTLKRSLCVPLKRTHRVSFPLF